MSFRVEQYMLSIIDKIDKVQNEVREADRIDE